MNINKFQILYKWMYLTLYYNYWSDNVAAGFYTKSLFISWYYKEYSLPCQDWQSIEQKLKNFNNPSP